MLVITELAGTVDDALLARRLVERVAVPAADSSKRRQRLTSDAGTEVALNLERGTFLRHGALLHDDGDRVIVVERPEEEVLLVSIDPSLPVEERVGAALWIGHAFGNQHVPVEIVDDVVRVPITTSRSLAKRTVRGLGLKGVGLEFAQVRLAADAPLTGHAHGT
ncbi:MAG: urease accessory protein UreE [Gaiellales bacterium]